MTVTISGVITSSISCRFDESNQAYNRADLSFHRGDYDNALKGYIGAISVDFSFALAYYNRALTYERVGRFEEATRDYLKFLSLSHEDHSMASLIAQEHVKELTLLKRNRESQRGTP